jgi:FkbM family methyltransferase
MAARLSSLRTLFARFAPLDALRIVALLHLPFRLGRVIRFGRLAIEVRDNRSDAYVVFDVIGKDPYLRRYGRDRLTRARTIVDVGAHVGSFALYAADIARDARVVAFEPSSETFALLARNVARNAMSNVETRNAALGARAGRASLKLSRLNPGANTLHALPDHEVAGREDVAVASFSDFLAGVESIDFLKLDCEGAEYDVLLPLRPDELAKIGYVAMEYHLNVAGRSPQELATFLEANGFDVVVEPPEKPGFGYLYAESRNRQ